MRKPFRPHSGRAWLVGLLFASCLMVIPLLVALDGDGDGVLDGTEVRLNLDPNDPDSDDDGTEDGDEDSDGDGLSNAYEESLNLDYVAIPLGSGVYPIHVNASGQVLAQTGPNFEYWVFIDPNDGNSPQTAIHYQ